MDDLNVIKVSVIIPVYNVESYLKAALDSIVNQTLREIEIICVNDGSTDNSRNIILEYQKNDSRIILIDKENGGLSSARNAGVDRATGKYIYFIDSDDTLDEDALETLFDVAEKGQLDVVDFNRKFIFESDHKDKEESFNKNLLRKHDYPNEVYTGQELFVEYMKNGEYSPTVWLHFMKLDFYRKNNLSFMDGIIHEDQAFTYLLYMKAKRCGFLNRYFYNHRIRSGSIMRQKRTEKNVYGTFVAMMVIKNYLQELIGKKDVFEASQKQFNSLMKNTYSVYHELENPDMSSLLKGSEINDFYSYYDMYNLINKSPAKKVDELGKKIKGKDSLIASLNKKIVQIQNDKESMEKALNKKETELKEKVELLEKTIRVIKKSKTYLVGRFVTWLPRKVLLAFRGSRLAAS